MFRNYFLYQRSRQSDKAVQTAKGSTKTMNDRSIDHSGAGRGCDDLYRVRVFPVSCVFYFFTVNYVTYLGEISIGVGVDRGYARQWPLLSSRK